MKIEFETQLIDEAKKGSVEAYEQLIKQYEHMIYAICIRMLHNEHDAFDVAQEVCIKIWRQIQTFEGNSKFSTWIYRVSTNQCLDTLRQKKRDLVMYSEQDEEKQQIEVADTVNLIEEYVEEKVLQDVITIALKEIKEEYSAIIVLRDMQGYSYEEIGKMLELNIGTVKSRISRARNALKKILLQKKEPYQSFFRQNDKKENSR
ncbi:MAG: RNA polymerase sigma factor [Cellulosilyticaceae bacterium]